MKYLVKLFNTISTPLFTNDFIAFQVIIDAEDDKDAWVKGDKIYNNWRKEDWIELNEYITKIYYRVEKLEDFIKEKERQGELYE